MNIRIPKDTKKPTLSITAPDANGISHNYFTEFNVGRRGLNIDNKNAAQTIINEVTGPDITRLRGNINVLANKATLIIANPNGINCNQCDVTNVNAFVKATGKIIYENDKMAGYSNITGDIAYFNTTVENRTLVMNDFAKNIKIKNSKLAPDALVLMSGFTGYKYAYKPVNRIQDNNYKPEIKDTSLITAFHNRYVKEKKWQPAGEITIDYDSVLTPAKLYISAEDSFINKEGEINAGSAYINLLHSQFNMRYYTPLRAKYLTINMRNSIFENTKVVAAGHVNINLYGSNQFTNSGSLSAKGLNVTSYNPVVFKYFNNEKSILATMKGLNKNHLKNTGKITADNIVIHTPGDGFYFVNTGKSSSLITKTFDYDAMHANFSNSGSMAIRQHFKMTGEVGLMASSPENDLTGDPKYQFRVNHNEAANNVNGHELNPL
ncbi:filamentous hemagglutinin N-terminal domain-containing protein [Morganella morganii]|uniref:filamentous hemagglutinin N-terminal domain-containing protein n=1 Tax=Morganella morganii TaxID=582 RepID=UPI001FFDE379|nr:filamentous hemagglutinin N-terminal domain-containing protein [Morganella morganii]